MTSIGVTFVLIGLIGFILWMLGTYLESKKVDGIITELEALKKEIKLITETKHD